MEQRVRGRIVSRGLGILVVIALVSVSVRTQESGRVAKVITPEGVRLLENRSFDDSDVARR